MKNFYLEASEELFLILDKIKKSHDDDITLVVPQGLPALRSIINLRILKEEAISLGKDISIVTNDTLIKKLAQQAGLRILDREIREKKDDWPEQLKEGGEIRPQFKAKPEIKKRRVISDIVKPTEAKEVRQKRKKLSQRRY
jgi:hypothetical protein